MSTSKLDSELDSMLEQDSRVLRIKVTYHVKS